MQLLSRDGIGRLFATRSQPPPAMALRRWAGPPAACPGHGRHRRGVDRGGRSDGAPQGQARVDLIINCAGLLHDGATLHRRNAWPTSRRRTRRAASRSTRIGPLLVAKHFQAAAGSRSGRAVFASLSARVGSIGDNRLGGWYATGRRRRRRTWSRGTCPSSCAAARAASSASRCTRARSTPGCPGRFSATFPRQAVPARAGRAPAAGCHRRARPADNGGFFAWDARPIPW